mmetsp:Transcript_20083/g.34549  ORF Transcript_20083/g.34549 Transcript_20083/m.34549 type:complete len:292 (+) Transcript_20083:1628-2503(+)
MQMDPEPMPMRRPSQPALMRAWACSCVTTFPATTSICGNLSLIHLIISIWYDEKPCDESITTTSTPACANAWHRSRSSGWVLQAAPQSSWLLRSKVARGKFCSFLRSDLLIKATSWNELLTIGSLPFLLAFSKSWASFKVTPSLPTINFSFGVITAVTFRPRWASGSRSTSRAVTIPSNCPPSFPVSVTGKPQNPFVRLHSRTSATVFSTDITNGSPMNPWRKLLTLRTNSTCSEMVLLLWMIPMPPRRAIFIAISDSVTVSMGELMKGVRSLIFFVNFDSSETLSAGKSI